MPYVKIGPRTLTATADLTGKNSGNLTTSFTGAVLNSTVPLFEVYHMVVSSVPAGAFANVEINNQPWGFTFPNLGSEWDPAQPIQLTPTDELDFFWSVTSATTPAPVTTIWLRYDPSLTTSGVLSSA